MPVPDRVEIDEAGDVVLSAEQAAGLLGVALEDFLADLRAGHVYSVIERGEGADAGRIRLTLHRRSTRRRLVVEAATGRVLETDPSDEA
ncbi:DUF6522 family protein [Falsiroseomonas sp. E2-1-a20]|uniref:DUF6522 family protein n=1 Tax=Falsiroseomonas sp. E2-1-a20 TaxID=3239300 RepID=UPI003F38876C